MLLSSPRRLIVASWLAGFAVVFSAAANPVAPTNVLQLVAPDETGTPLSLSGHLRDAEGRPVAGATIRVYQTDATGRYTRDQPMDEPHARLAGFLQTDLNGNFALHTIRPGGYPKAVRLGDRDRQIPAHIHLDLTAAGRAERRLQLVFADDPLLSDPYWADWVTKLGQPVVTTRRTAQGESGEVILTLR
jgi:protocatechuate 3,4-dioxygenase beta subunit